MEVKKATTAQLKREVARLEKELKRREKEDEKVSRSKAKECFNALKEGGLLQALVDVRCTYEATYTECVTVYIRDCIDVLDCEEDDLSTSIKELSMQHCEARKEAEEEALQQTWGIVQEIQGIVKTYKQAANRELRQMINDHLNELEAARD